MLSLMSLNSNTAGFCLDFTTSFAVSKLPYMTFPKHKEHLHLQSRRCCLLGRNIMIFFRRKHFQSDRRTEATQHIQPNTPQRRQRGKPTCQRLSLPCKSTTGKTQDLAAQLVLPKMERKNAVLIDLTCQKQQSKGKNQTCMSFCVTIVSAGNWDAGYRRCHFVMTRERSFLASKFSA